MNEIDLEDLSLNTLVYLTELKTNTCASDIVGNSFMDYPFEIGELVYSHDKNEYQRILIEELKKMHITVDDLYEGVVV